MFRNGLLLLMLVAAAGCSTRANPVNWFGSSEDTTESLVPEIIENLDDRPLIDQIASMNIERLPGGAIVRATGVTSMQGYWDASLVVENNGIPQDGVLILTFRVRPPVTRQPVGNTVTREVVSGVFLSDQTLAPVQTITVIGARNRRSVRR